MFSKCPPPQSLFFFEPCEEVRSGRMRKLGSPDWSGQSSGLCQPRHAASSAPSPSKLRRPTWPDRPHRILVTRPFNEVQTCFHMSSLKLWIGSDPPAACRTRKQTTNNPMKIVDTFHAHHPEAVSNTIPHLEPQAITSF